MKANYKNIINSGLLGLGLSFCSSAFLKAEALPPLQLDILGGKYNSDEGSVYTSQENFSLSAYCLLEQNGQDGCDLDHYISVSVVPKGTSSADFGSFEINGTSYSYDDLTYGEHSLDDETNNSVYSLFLEQEFEFDPNLKRKGVDVKTDAGTLVDSLNINSEFELAYKVFDIDTSQLKQGFELHFDLYKKMNNGDDIFAEDFAKFFQNTAANETPTNNPSIPIIGNDNPSEVPESGTTAALGLFALGAFTFLRKKPKKDF
jgi:hypothetical protein